MTETDLPGRSLMQRTVSASALSFVLNAIVLFTSVLTGILVVRRLGASAYGLYTLTWSIVTIGMFFMLAGFENAISRFVPELRAQGRAGTAGRLLIWVLVFGFAGWAVVVGVYHVALEDLIAHLYGAETARLVGLALIVALPAIVGMVLGQALLAVFRVASQVLASAVAAVVTVTLVVLFVQTPAQAILATALGSLAGTSVLAVRVFVRREEFRGPMGQTPLRRSARYSTSFLASNLLNAIVYRQSEVLVLGLYVAPAVIASYNIAYALPQRLLEFIPLVLLSVGSVSIAEAFSRDHASLPRAIDAYYRLLFLVVAPLSVGGAVLGGVLTTTLFGEQYSLAGQAAQYFFALFSLVFLTTPYSLVMRAWERVWTGVALKSGQAVVNIGLDFLLIPRFGFWGAIAAVTATVIVSTITNFAVLGRIDRSVKVPWRAISRCYLAALPIAALIPFVSLLSTPAVLAAGFIAAFVLWIAGVRLVRLIGPVERRVIDESTLPASLRNGLLRVIAG